MDLSNVRIKEHFGIVTNITGTSQLAFLVSPPKNRKSIEKEDIICLDHPLYGEACQVLAQVNEITSYEEVAGSTIGERVGRLQATAKIIGYFDLREENKPLRKLLVPPHPGSRIYVPYAKFLEDVFSRGAEGRTFKTPLHLGKTEILGASTVTGLEQLNFYLDADDLTLRNTLVSAVDGAGKTHAVRVIIEELANKTSEPIIVIDPNSEYTTIGATAKKDQTYQFNFQTATINIDTNNNQDLIDKKIKKYKVAVITAENLTLEEKNKCYSDFLNSLATSRQQKTTQPFILIVEEAENVSSQAIQENLSTKNSATILVTSHPSLLGGKVLSQMQTQIVGKTTDPKDVELLKNMVEGTEESLSSLRVGEWVINGLNVIRPTKIHTRERYS